MYHQYGTSYFSILATDKQRAEILDICDRWGAVVEKIREYKVYEDNDISYYFILLCISDYRISGEKLCEFILQSFPYVAIRQEESTYIIVSNKEDFKTAIKSIYKTKENKIYFLYDMLTLNERYAILSQSTNNKNTLEDLQFTHVNEIGNVYQLDLTPDATLLYREDSDFEITNTFTGEVLDIDIADYIPDFFVFHVAIFDNKILKNTR